MDIYFDNCATTKTNEKALSKIIEMSTTCYGNPSSTHKMGFMAEKEITNSRRNISNVLNVKEDEIYFLSGATEGNNLAIIGTCYANKRSGNHIITEKSEHPSVLESFKMLEKEGFSVTYLENDESGNISIDDLKNAITDDTILVSLMHVNNETGVIFDLEKIGKVIKEKNKDTLFHVDAVQSFCKIDIDINKWKIDLLTISGHKVHAPKGVGALYIRKGTKIFQRQYGGTQEKKVRSGTENIIGITALGEAVNDLFPKKSEYFDYVTDLKNDFLSIKDEIEDVFINGENTSPYIANISIIGVKGEVLVHALEDKNIFISTGSACHKGEVSTILTNYGLSADRASSCIRIGFCNENTHEELEILKNAIKEIVPMLRKFKKR